MGEIQVVDFFQVGFLLFAREGTGVHRLDANLDTILVQIVKVFYVFIKFQVPSLLR